ncbi:DUF1178 family protein [Roseospirillum parvum]|uniref:Uncharacterized protein n=1 Tax=Roseospirillum parvum TaxID=83401 RepID=A0A1G7U8T9_9PROT|nr:DUF1178 family protein [Roseospirillum parvum]SDG43449.1 hypothetical protein SAMN05421742_101235 [Roseospirillum parvum]
MIRYALICREGHEFEGWFPDSTRFEAQVEAGEVRCPVCDSVEVRRALMAPNLTTARQAAAGRAEQAAALRQALVEVRRKVEASCDNVGDRFPEEARRIHYGEVAPRGIFGTSTPDEARELLDEGVDILPLPDLAEN